MAEPEIPDLYRVTPDEIRLIDAVLHEHRQVRMVDAFRALVELRHRHAGFAKRLEVIVYVPECEDCHAEERRRFHADDSTWRPPDITPRSWRQELREYGASEREIRRTYREMRARDSEFPLVQCDTCKAEINYLHDNVYISGRPFEEHFQELVGREEREPPVHPPRVVRELVYRVYEGKCARCGVDLAPEEATMDHIRPRHEGGRGTLENLQLACAACNNAKGSGDPPIVTVYLDFLLVAQAPPFRILERLAAL